MFLGARSMPPDRARCYPSPMSNTWNLVGVAAGLASAGKKVFAVSPACFLTARALEQIKNDVAYSDNPVKLIGISAVSFLACTGL